MFDRCLLAAAGSHSTIEDLHIAKGYKTHQLKHRSLLGLGVQMIAGNGLYRSVPTRAVTKSQTPSCQEFKAPMFQAVPSIGKHLKLLRRLPTSKLWFGGREARAPSCTPCVTAQCSEPHKCVIPPPRSKEVTRRICQKDQSPYALKGQFRSRGPSCHGTKAVAATFGKRRTT